MEKLIPGFCGRVCFKVSMLLNKLLFSLKTLINVRGVGEDWITYRQSELF